MLPKLPHTGNLMRRGQTAFGGLDRRAGAGEGALREMNNLTGADYPVLTVRPPRCTARHLTAPGGVYAAGKLFTAENGGLYVDGVYAGALSAGEKTFCALGSRVVIFPDKKIYTAEGTLESLEASFSAAGMTFGNGTYAGEDAEANSIIVSGGRLPFRVGDAVTITGCTLQPENNKTPIVREISEDGKTLRFYEHTFTLPEGVSEITEPGVVTLARTVPELSFLCENENRLWGCAGDEIYCCKLGDPYNWNVYDGLSTDAWSVSTGSPGNFTAAASFLGYPVFFKEEKIFKVYGSKPANFEVMSSATMGVSVGSGKSLAVAGETLFYLSRSGVAAYSGGIPSVISSPLGEGPWHDAVGGSDGLRYWISMADSIGERRLYVWDTEHRLWHCEDDPGVMQMVWHDGLYALCRDGALVLLGDSVPAPENAEREQVVESMAEFADVDGRSFDAQYPVRLRLRLEAEEDAAVQAEIMYDSSGKWEAAGSCPAGQSKRSVYLPLPIRRCDHFRLRLRGTGLWKLHALETEYYNGSYPRK